jgi:hypothetical protein
MDTNQAMAVLQQATAQSKLTLQEHQAVLEALKVISEFIDNNQPQDIKEAKKDERKT